MQRDAVARAADVTASAGMTDETRPDGSRAGARRRLRFSLQTGLIAVTLVTVLVTAAAVHLPWSYTARQNVADVANRLNGEIINGISKEVGRLFERAEAVQTVIQETFAKRIVDIEDRRRRDELYLSFLKANPHFSWVSFGYPNGDFFGAQRRDDVNFRVVNSVWDDATKAAMREIAYYVFDSYNLYHTQTKTKTNDYYAPNRQWYERAILTEQAIWTDVYVFASSGKPGINTAVRLDIGGQTVGVISIAMELERLSLYLRSLSVGESGVAFIVNGAGEMIAFPDPSVVTKQTGDDVNTLALRRLSAAPDGRLQIAAAALQASGLQLAQITESRQLRHRMGEHGPRHFVTLAPVGHADWVVGTVIPESDFLAAADRNTDRLAYALLAAVVLVALLAAVTCRLMFIRPLDAMIRQARLVEQFELSEIARVPTQIIEIDRLSGALVQMSRGLRAFQRYLPTELVRTLSSHGMVAELGGERRTLTMFFMDLQGFTEITERMGHRVLPHLADYLSDMSGEIGANRGTIDKYIGDAIMAFWGAPAVNENHAVDACRAALACVRLLEIRRVEWAREGRPQFRARIGINTGRVIVGNIGSNEKLDYTVVGDPVNLASRLEGLNKDYGTEILIGQQTYDLARYDVVARRLDAVTVKGKDERVNVFELLSMQDEAGDKRGFEWIAEYERGLDMMREHEHEAAIACFRKADGMRPGGDRPSVMMRRRCEKALGIAEEAAEATLPASAAPVADALRALDDAVQEQGFPRKTARG